MPDLVFAGTDTGVNMDTGGMLHHVVNVDFSRWDVTCPPGFGDVINQLGLLQGGNERFFAAGNKRTLNTLYTTGNNGYHVKAGDKWGDSERSVPAGYSDSTGPRPSPPAAPSWRSAATPTTAASACPSRT
ncbi:hypothetical protein ACIHFD_41855 [Nonomuraea sp. NPDC051941]|uniref:hypothetical protein n=1 Tax=Nonomuraea sp. NPDC051941 TaxID=3364373 RepID=UPI0037C64DED